MSARPPVLMWFRRDLRLADNPALVAACEGGGSVIPVFVLDPETEALGAASRWRLGRSVAALAAALEARGSRLILRRGPARETLLALASETGAMAAHWSRLYAPDTVTRDRAVKAELSADGIDARSHPGHLLHEPWTTETKTGGHFRVYTPFWNALGPREVGAPLAEPALLPAPERWPDSAVLEDWRLGADMRRGAEVVARHAVVGEAAARDRLAAFVEHRLGAYAEDRNRPDLDATSRLSENLTHGEISPRQIWAAVARAEDAGASAKGVETFRKEIVWREFAWHLMWHAQQIDAQNWRSDWDVFPWRDDNADAERWRRGMTGEPMVDAGLRQMYVTGTMHNRVRMIAASYLTKHLMTHWRIGLAWFAECLIDWDPASNAMGWQWVAGSGPDAAPYFRIFNPATQAEKFDPDARYRRRFLADRDTHAPHADALAFFDAAPKSWGIDPQDPYPKPVIDLQKGREAALAAYSKHSSARERGGKK